mmetsp:Transcript_53259/g.53687  ORF Transcript_53259/g.53687 Transcript_53259/m.53687 type:complete len:80 (+) Transcript_53259:264-503(+)
MMLYDEGSPVFKQDHESWGDTMNVADDFNDAVKHQTEDNYLNETIVSNITFFSSAFARRSRHMCYIIGNKCSDLRLYIP